jgi:hypothetical protein
MEQSLDSFSEFQRHRNRKWLGNMKYIYFHDRIKRPFLTDQCRFFFNVFCFSNTCNLRVTYHNISIWNLLDLWWIVFVWENDVLMIAKIYKTLQRAYILKNIYYWIQDLNKRCWHNMEGMLEELPEMTVNEKLRLIQYKLIMYRMYYTGDKIH